MASTLDLELQSIDSSRRFITRKYLVTLDDDYAAGGMVVDFTAASNPNFLEGGAPGYGIDITDPKVKLSLPNPGGVGYLFRIEKGTDWTDSLLRIFQSDDAVDALDELPATALPSALTDDVDIYIELTTPVGF